MLSLQPSYLSQFIDSILYGMELNGQSCNREQISSEISGVTAEAKLGRSFVRTTGKDFAENYLARLEQRSKIAHSCHATSHGFARTWENNPSCNRIGLAITIGNVFFRGENIYGTTRQSISELLHHGFNPDLDVKAHVWLTTGDMTVIDLTIISTLNARGYIEEPPQTNRVLVWNEECPGDFEFAPLLVDNDFFNKVERGLISYE